MKLAMVLFCALLLSGCAAQRQYQWGNYEPQLYAAYQDPNKMEALRLGLEAQIEALEKTGQRVPPGFYAELGTLYLQGGSQDKAMLMYGRERDAWPESTGLMTALIQNLERLKNKSAERALEATPK